MISDSTEPHERAKGFGIIGASFGFGFVIGPAISAFTVQWGIHVPFIIAGVIALAATVLTYIILPETNKHIGQVSHAKSQGSILGVNSSYMSIGLIVGPVLGGILATYYIPLPFLVGYVLSLICLLVSFKLLHANFVSKEFAF